MRTEQHPTLGILVRENGTVLVPASGTHPAHWTAGSQNRDGYRGARIRGRHYSIHRLVAETFIPNPENKMEVDHINRNKADNRVENLRWTTHRENRRNCADHDRVDARGGVHPYGDKARYSKEQWVRYRKGHRRVVMADGRRKYLPTEVALEMLKLPVKERVLSS